MSVNWVIICADSPMRPQVNTRNNYDALSIGLLGTKVGEIWVVSIEENAFENVGCKTSPILLGSNVLPSLPTEELPHNEKDPISIHCKATNGRDSVECNSKETGPRLNIEIVFKGMVIPKLMIKRSWHRLIYNMGIPILLRRHLYIETTPWLLVNNESKDAMYIPR